MKVPNNKGHFGRYGGRFVPETLMPALIELEQAYKANKKNKEFRDNLSALQKDFIGRPTALYYAHNLTKHLGGAKIYLKREDLCHTGAHKINNAIGQAPCCKQALLKKLIRPNQMRFRLPTNQRGSNAPTPFALP